MNTKVMAHHVSPRFVRYVWERKCADVGDITLIPVVRLLFSRGTEEIILGVHVVHDGAQVSGVESKTGNHVGNSSSVC